jgi:signal transduction histidine kinase
MALPLMFGNIALGAVTVQSVEERAFSQDDITTLLTMAEHLAVAINNAYTLERLNQAHVELLRAKVFEALTTATTEAIHWIGNKTLPISLTIARLREEIADNEVNFDSLSEDLDMIAESAAQITQVKEQLIGAVREQMPRPVLLADVFETAALQRGLPADLLALEVDPSAAYAIADSTQLVRALGNLLQNASEAGAKKIRVSVTPSTESGMLKLTLADDGAGMSAETLQKAWSPFFSTRGHQGLGLPASLHVISQAQGRITLTSTEGKGSLVEIHLPYERISDNGFSAGSLTNLLLVDDDDAWASAFAQTLAKAGVKVKRQTSLDKFPAADLILVDEHCAAVNVDDTLSALGKAGLLSKTVVLTAALNPERVTQFLRAGVKDVQAKPYTAAEMSALLSICD